MENIITKTILATKWASITEILAKLIAPITNMILARLLAPEDFGILATITMVISFAEIFVESGFQKFLIQHNFLDEQVELEYMSVAFWANLIFSFAIWVLIGIFNVKIASLVGNPGMGYLIVISCVTIPLYGVIGIQNCKIKKSLDFKKLFWVRIISALVPFFITVPLVMIGWSYWALIIGNIVGAFVRALMLILVGKFKPLIYFSFHDFKYMFSFAIWTLLDGIVVWLTVWIDSFLISRTMTEHYLGLYKNSISVVTALFTIATASIAPVLFSALSRLQDNEKEFRGLFLNTQKALCMIILPVGMGLYLYRDLATLLLFGDNWIEAADIIGVFSLTIAVRTIFASFYSDAFRAKGNFKAPLFIQLIDLIFLIPACLISVKYGFWSLVYTRALIKLDILIPAGIALYIICNISIIDIWRKIHPYIISTAIMYILAIYLQSISTSILWSFISVFICILIYFGTLLLNRAERKIINDILKEKFMKKD